MFFLQTILNDWNAGKIKYYTHPPETETKETHVSAAIVETFAKEFSLDNLENELTDITEPNPSETMAIESSGMISNIHHEDDDEDNMSETEEVVDDMEENEENIGQLSKRLAFNTKTKAKSNNDDSTLPKFKVEGLNKMKKAAKIREKKEKKDRKRRDKVATELSNDLDHAFEALGKTSEEKYDFDQDYSMK